MLGISVFFFGCSSFFSKAITNLYFEMFKAIAVKYPWSLKTSNFIAVHGVEIFMFSHNQNCMRLNEIYELSLLSSFQLWVPFYSAFLENDRYQVVVLTVLPTTGDQLSAILNSIQSRPNLPAPSIFDQAAKPPSSLVHSPFVFGQPLSFQQPQPQLQSKFVSLTCLISPFSAALTLLFSVAYQLLIIPQCTFLVLFFF